MVSESRLLLTLNRKMKHARGDAFTEVLQAIGRGRITRCEIMSSIRHHACFNKVLTKITKNESLFRVKICYLRSMRSVA